MTNIAVAVINASTTVQDSDVVTALPALQMQVSEHLAPVWGVDASLYFVPHGSTPPVGGVWWLTILDNSDQAGTLGYHDLTEDGFPLGKVFAATDMAYGNSWTVTASHELLEMLIDPDINQSVLVDNGDGGTLYAYEICDACEADEYGYPINGVLLSDFVFPAWFESFRKPGSCQFDATQQLSEAFEIASAGYISIYDIQAGNGWHQMKAAQPRSLSSRAHIGSRRERRQLRRDQWLLSKVRAH